MREVQGTRTQQDRTAEGGSRQRENHGKQGMSDQTVTGQHVPRRMSGKTTPKCHAVAVTTQEASDGSREKTKRVMDTENNSLNWVSISSAGALDMPNCDFSERRARDEMRHIIGRSEPDVIIGLIRTETEDVRRRRRTISNFCVDCTKHKLRRDATLCTK